MDFVEYLVIGAGPAGGAAARELARHAPPGSVLLVGEEPLAPYERPPLSKTTLADLANGADSPPRPMLGSAEELEAAGVRLLLGMRAGHIDRCARLVTLADGRRIGYGRLLLATGTRARRLGLAGADRPNVHYLRTYGDAVALAPRLVPGARVVIVGGGFIGLEVAATASRLGCAVAVLEAGPCLMGRALPAELAERFRAKFARHGVDVRLRAAVAALHGSESVESVRLGSGDTLPADLLVAGIGAVPNTELAEAAGLEVDDGILTDAAGATSDSCIHAAGDVARRMQGLATHPGHRVRLEAWEPALEQAVATAQAMLGRPSVPVRPPWMWTDQFDWNLQVAGHGQLADTQIVRPLGEDRVAVFQLWQRRLIGAIALNAPREMALARRALQRPPTLDPERLADPSTPLREVLAA